MTDRRMIDDAAPGSLRHALLHAGRQASPAESSKKRLLETLAQGTPSAPPAATQASSHAAAASAKTIALAKWTVLSLVGATAVVGALRVVSERTPEPPANDDRRPTSTVQDAVAPAASNAPVPVAPVIAGTMPDSGSDENASSRAKRVPQMHVKRSAPRMAHASGHASSRSVGAVAAEAPASNDSEAAEPSGTPKARSSSAEPTQVREGREHDGLKQELRELDAVREAIRAGSPAAASAALERYWRRFPNGYLRPEAERLENRLKPSH
jgi:hypothetical protein